MGLIISDRYVSTLIKVIQITDTLKSALQRVRAGSADAALQRWFGDNSADFKKEFSKKLDKMRAIVNLQDVHVSFRTLKEQNPYENAAALPNSVASIVPGTTSNYQGAQILLNANFSRLPNTLPLLNGSVDASGYNQSKLNTFFHELSHAVFGTADEALTDGNTAYGAQQALALVGQDSTKAKNNAENWGIFIEACGFHNAQ